MIVTNETKPPVVSMSGNRKTLSTFSTDNKTGSAWLYEEADLTYEMSNLFYNYFGTTLTIYNEAKI